MNPVSELHNKAMELADSAFSAQRRGRADEARALFEQALEHEKAAIAELEARGRIEPNYSVLHRSAAWLALNGDLPREAEKIAANALAQDPHPAILPELRDVMEQAFFKGNLAAGNVTLAPHDLRMHFVGNDVGYGWADQSEVAVRIDSSLKIIRRLDDLHQAKPFEEKIASKNPYRFYSGLAEAASYAVTLRLATSFHQPELPGVGMDVESRLGEFVELMATLNDATNESVEERIPDDAYRRNFLALAKRMAPDGDRIKKVDFATKLAGEPRTAALDRPAKEMPTFRASKDPQRAEPKEIYGQLLYADATKTNKIKLVEDEGNTHAIIVPKGMMNDIVRPLWDSYVRVIGTPKGKSLVLDEIDPADPPPNRHPPLTVIPA